MDDEAVSLLCCVDASCTMLLRVVSNVLQMRTLQRDGALVLAMPRLFDPKACIRRVVEMVAALEADPSRLVWASEPLPLLPPQVLGDEGTLTACLENVCLAALRWLPSAHASGDNVRLRILTEHRIVNDEVMLSATAHASEKTGASVDEFTLVIECEVPGRPLTAQEIDAVLAPFSMMPADKGGGTGLGLFVTRGLARSLGGDLELLPLLPSGTLFRVHMLMRVAPAAPMPDFAAAEAEPLRRSSVDESKKVPQLPPRMRGPGDATATEVQPTTRMFECLLSNCDDVFAICRIHELEGERADEAAAANAPRIVARVEYISPSVVWRLAFSQAEVIGQDSALLSRVHVYAMRGLTLDARSAWGLPSGRSARVHGGGRGGASGR